MSYDEQKKCESEEFKTSQARIEHMIGSDGDKLEIFSQVLSEIAARDPTYKNLLGTVADGLKEMATSSKVQLVG